MTDPVRAQRLADQIKTVEDQFPYGIFYKGKQLVMPNNRSCYDTESNARRAFCSVIKPYTKSPHFARRILEEKGLLEFKKIY